ncbi:MAG TPA: hypothetical protein VIJ10_17035 [Vicinamibacteria bacterium]|jgi:hypothetical protein
MPEFQVALNNAPRLRVMALSAIDAVEMVALTFRKARLGVAIDPSGRVSSYTIDRAGTARLLEEEPED